MNSLTRAVCLGSALVLSACGGPEPVEEGEALGQQSAGLTTASSQGCNYSVSTVLVTASPASHDVVLTRTGGTGCPLPTGASVVVAHVVKDRPSSLALVGNSLGLAVGFVMRTGPLEPARYKYALRHVNPATLGTVRSADFACDYGTGDIYTGTLSLSGDGTGVGVSGTKTGLINGQAGNYYTATFLNFFTSTTPPTYSVY
ncbi:hypothetical protein [Corallococcus llansteffanensis]|uniref:Lipoprotein n=1 Tax=Corallococcus llansteffanensis TaxID=2316731 RepID=A0A3A8PW98_9BACT|nr:hypothetical protein [Corallococcus llansteffanensis]RKH60737.1 hypothetical protein D7V93_12840 [Corallococcus llansteffanensis]